MLDAVDQRLTEIERSRAYMEKRLKAAIEDHVRSDVTSDLIDIILLRWAQHVSLCDPSASFNIDKIMGPYFFSLVSQISNCLRPFVLKNLMN